MMRRTVPALIYAVRDPRRWSRAAACTASVELAELCALHWMRQAWAAKRAAEERARTLRLEDGNPGHFRPAGHKPAI